MVSGYRCFVSHNAFIFRIKTVTLKMEIRSFAASVTDYQSAWPDIPERLFYFQQQWCMNLKSSKINSYTDTGDWA
jgi:hypothetical protein